MTGLDHWFLEYVPPAIANPANPAKTDAEISDFSRNSIRSLPISEKPGIAFSGISGFSVSSPAAARCAASPSREDHAFALAERAAIIEHEAGIPREWAEAFARVDCMERPAGISRGGWQRIVDNLGRMLDSREHLRDLARFRWEIGDVFGVHPAAPERRQDAKGLLVLMQEGEVISIVNEQVIGLQRTGSGTLLCYYRPRLVSAERVMLWELR